MVVLKFGAGAVLALAPWSLTLFKRINSKTGNNLLAGLVLALTTASIAILNQ